MDPYDDETPKLPAFPPLNVEVKGVVNYDHVVDVLASKAEAAIKARIEAKVDAAIADAAENLVSTLLTEKVKRVVNEVIDQGFMQVDNYGRELPRKPLQQMVLEILGKKDQYDRQNMVEKLVMEGMRFHVEHAVKEEAQRAKAKLAVQVDELVQAKLGELLRGALGLK